jgi:hypothetical protein
MWLALAFFALSLSAQTPDNGLPPLAPPAPEIKPTYWEQHVATPRGAAIHIAGLLLVAGAGVGLWMISRPKPKPMAPVNVATRAALEELKGKPETGEVLGEVSRVLRRYIGTVFKFPPGELTTAEFSAALGADQKIGGELAQRISDFLRACDQRKFSKAPADAPINAAERARALVELAEARHAWWGRAQARAQTGSGNSQISKKPGVAAPRDGRAPQ